MFVVKIVACVGTIHIEREGIPVIGYFYILLKIYGTTNGTCKGIGVARKNNRGR